MIKKLNLVCVLAIALSNSCVMAADVPVNATSSSGWGNRVTDAAKLLGVVGIVGLIIAAYVKFRAKSRGNRLVEAPKPEHMPLSAAARDNEELRVYFNQQLTAVQQAMNQRVDSALAAQERAGVERCRLLQQRLDEGLAHIRGLVESIEASDKDQDKTLQLCARKQAVNQSLVECDARLDVFKRKTEEEAVSIQARLTALEALQTQNVTRKEHEALGTKVSGNEMAIATVNGRVTDLVRKQANLSLRLDKASQERVRAAQAEQVEESHVHFDVPMSPTAADSHGAGAGVSSAEPAAEASA